MLDDTPPHIHDLVARLIAERSIPQRMAMVQDLTAQTIRWSRAAIRDTMPDASEHDVLLRWVEVTYGRELADRLRASGRRLGA